MQDFVPELSTTDSKNFFQSEGYFIWKNLISSKVVDEILSHYNAEILASRKFFIRANGGRWLPHELNPHGYMIKPLADPHDLDDHYKFGASIRDLLCG